MDTFDISKLNFSADGLIPAIISDCNTGNVLMMAYMNSESLEITLREGKTCFWSRSRKELWRKGETSGNVQTVVSIKADCDLDTLLIRVSPAGPACHTGEDSCFFNVLHASDELSEFSIDALYEMLVGRKQNPKEGSYTSYLFEKGLDKILKKVGEESTEVIIAAKSNDRAETVYEIADLAYHVLTLMVEANLTPDDIRHELSSRHVVDKKVKQEKSSNGIQ